jgi:hypothetical protein
MSRLVLTFAASSALIVPSGAVSSAFGVAESA